MSSISTLYDEVGKDVTARILGVHHNTLYKWKVYEDGRKGGRNPNNAAVRLADVCQYLMEECEWEVEDLIKMSEALEHTLPEVAPE